MICHLPHDFLSLSTNTAYAIDCSSDNSSSEGLAGVHLVIPEHLLVLPVVLVKLDSVVKLGNVTTHCNWSDKPVENHEHQVNKVCITFSQEIIQTRPTWCTT